MPVTWQARAGTPETGVNWSGPVLITPSGNAKPDSHNDTF
jgi:hypothetical protein